MAAHDNLSQQLFHGTMADLKPGDIVSPRSHGEHDNVNFGVNPSYGEETHDYAYATDDVEEAKWFGGKGKDNYHVYEVEPVGKVTKRPLYKKVPKGGDPKDFTANEFLSTEGFKVKRKVQ